jgi:hypothetical protein
VELWTKYRSSWLKGLDFADQKEEFWTAGLLFLFPASSSAVLPQSTVTRKKKAAVSLFMVTRVQPCNELNTQNTDLSKSYLIMLIIAFNLMLL